jgi:hypothetical protein
VNSYEKGMYARKSVGAWLGLKVKTKISVAATSKQDDVKHRKRFCVLALEKKEAEDKKKKNPNRFCQISILTTVWRISL